MDIELLLKLENIFARYHVTVLMVSFSFSILLILIFLNRSLIIAQIKIVDKKIWFYLFLIFVFSFLLRYFIPYKQLVDVYDETYYIDAATRMFDFNESGWYYQKSIGWPFILALVFKVFTPSMGIVFLFSIFLASLTVFPLFLFANLIFKDAKIALFSTIIFALLPYQIFWSATAGVHSVSLFFSTCTLFFLLLYLKYSKSQLLWLLVFSFIFISQIRLENIGLFFLICLVLVYHNRGEIISFFKKIPLILLSFLLFATPNFLITFLWYREYYKGYYNPREWALGSGVVDFFAYSANLFNGKIVPYFWSLLLVLGLVYLYRKNKKIFVIIFLWFFYMILYYFVFWMDTPSVISGEYPIFLTVRGFYNIYPLFIIFMTGGVMLVVDFINKRFKISSYKFFFVLFLFNFVIISVVPLYGNLRKGNFSYRRLEAMIMSDLEKDVGEDCSLILPKQRVATFLRNISIVNINNFFYNYDSYKDNDCLLFLSDFFCAKYLSTYSLCQRMQNEFELTLYKSYSLGESEYILYKIEGEK